MIIKVFADTICGWCFIGQTKLNRALKNFPGTKFEIEHVPFQLNPDMPKKGIERDQYLKIKFGGKEFAQPMFDHMTEEAKKEGLNFNLHSIKKTPYTVPSHLLIKLAEQTNVQNQVKEKSVAAEVIKINELKNIKEPIYALYPTVGENLDYLQLNQLKNIEFIYREIDQFSWQFCNKGFFNFKNHIPKIVTRFN